MSKPETQLGPAPTEEFERTGSVSAHFAEMLETKGKEIRRKENTKMNYSEDNPLPTALAEGLTFPP